jgi:hypothetical protein
MKLNFILFMLAISFIFPLAVDATNISSENDNDGIVVIAKLVGKNGKPVPGVELMVFKVENKVSVVQQVRNGKVVGPTGKSNKNGILIISIPKDFLQAGDNFTFGTESSWLTKEGSPALFTWPTKIKNKKVLLGDVHLN